MFFKYGIMDKSNYGFLLLFFVFLVIVSSSVSAIQWHNCCDVTINENELNSLYHNFVENNYCYQGISYDDCLANAVKDGRSFENFKQVLVDNPKTVCFEKTDELKDEFENGYDGLFGKTDFKSIDYFFPDVYFENPFSQRITIQPISYDVEKTLWKENRFPGKLFDDFIVSSSRFSYLNPTKISISKINELYLNQYNSAKKICDSIDLPFDNYEENGALYDSCMKKNFHFSKDEIDAYYWYSDLKGSFYVKALSICEEELGFQNDLGLINFPGQSSVSCGDGDLVDGCCPGYHKDQKFDVCCSAGFEAYEAESGSIICGPAQLDDEIISVDISLNKNELLLNGKDSILAKLSFSARTPLGEIVPYANKKIFNGIMAESKTSQFSFDVKKLSDTTDADGNLDVVISLKDANVDSLGLDKNDPVKVFVYSLDEEDKDRSDVFFTLSYGDGLRIVDVEQLSDDAWQGSPVQLRVHVDDPLNEKKMYIFSSKTGFRLDGSSEDFMAFKTTKDNDLDFSWFAPVISQKMKMDYTKRLLDGLVKMSLVAAEDIAGNKLDGRIAKLEKEGVELSSRYNKLNKFYGTTNTLVKADIQAGSAIKQGQLMAQTASEPYQVAKKGISYLMWLEGTIGLLGKPATPLLTTLKVGLTGIDEWYSAVEDLEKVAKSKKITLEFPVTVTVKGLQSGTNDTFTKNIPVQGFEMVLG